MQTQTATEQNYSGAVSSDRRLELANAMIDLGDIATRENLKAELGWDDAELDYYSPDARRIASRRSTRRVA